MPLVSLPADKLKGLVPLLAGEDIALLESAPDGSMKQVTVLMAVAASPETVHAVLAHPGEYKNFIPNVTKSTWEPHPDGSGLCTWEIKLPVSSFEQVNLYHFEPGPAGAVRVSCPSEADDATYRWELLSVPSGTVLVQYGYTDVKRSNALVRSFLKRMPVTEHGLALAAQLLLASSVRREAERRTAPGSLPPPAPSAAMGKGPGLGFLLDRGQVAVMRSTPDGKLSDISLLDRIYAPLDEVREMLVHPAAFHSFVPGVEETEESGRAGDSLRFRFRFAIPLVSWSTNYAMRFSARTVEVVGLSGDLKGAHLQWDLTAHGPKETLAVYRVNEHFGQSSALFRRLISYDQTLEHGLTVAFNLVFLRALRARSEHW